MSTKRCYYEVLTIERTADGTEIKRAYRKLALKYHPDTFKGDKSEGETRFKELAEAYEVLSDGQKRQRYDQYGHQGMQGSGVHDFSNMGFGDIFSMFGDIFGGGQGGHRRSQGATGVDLQTEVEITLEEAYTGCDRSMDFHRSDHCPTCDGSGAKAGTTPTKCPTCGGYGQVQQQSNSFFGMSVHVIDCPDCAGTGELIDSPCGDCRGTGRARAKRELKVSIPAGIEDGQTIRVRSEGEYGRTRHSPRGDLHVSVYVAEHPLLKRHGNDLVCQLPVSYAKAVLGGPVDIPTLNGQESIDIPSGTQPGDIITLKQRGLPGLRSGRVGAQHIQIVLEVPHKVDAQHRSLLEQLAELDDETVTPKRKSFLETLKSCFTD
jgi:molecular chaperone DnaJ